MNSTFTQNNNDGLKQANIFICAWLKMANLFLDKFIFRAGHRNFSFFELDLITKHCIYLFTNTFANKIIMIKLMEQ